MRIQLPENQQDNPLAYLPDHFAPEIVKAGMAFATAVYMHSTLTTRECEAARARTAEINGCILCQNFRAARDLPGYFQAMGAEATDTVAARGEAPDDEFYKNVSNWQSYPDYTERERLAIQYAEGMGLEPKKIAQDEAFWERAKAAFSDNEIVDLTYALASRAGSCDPCAGPGWRLLMDARTF